MLSIKRPYCGRSFGLLSFKDSNMRTITCNECGHEIAEDDFMLQHCPVCDSYMAVNRLNIKVDEDLDHILRIDPVQASALVERD